MKDQKIIICTTFRDFKGTENDRIQRLFLRSLESQKYQNFEIVVTLFGEKEVKGELEKFNLKSFFYDGESDGFRYSLTQVVLNAIGHAEKNENENYIVLWTTCDIVLDDNFLYRIIKNYKINSIGTSHPHTMYSSVDDYENNRSCIKSGLFNGFDLIYFDKEFLQTEKVSKSLKKYVYNDWGIFEHFLVSLGAVGNNPDMINLYEDAKIYKIENERNLTNEPSQFLINSHMRNSLTFKNFIRDNSLSNNYFDLTYCHFKFRQIKNSFAHYMNFKKDIIEFIFNQVKKIISKLIPDFIKNVIRG
jgi:hypothetical protein